jgi:hypothetical protein
MEQIGNGDSGGGFINFDPDAAATYIITPIEEVVRHYNLGADEDYKTYMFKSIYHNIPFVINGLSSYLHIPASKVATCAIDIGVNNLTLRLGTAVERINSLRGKVLLAKGCLREDKEAVARDWAVEFKSSQKRTWPVRLLEGVVVKADRFAAMAGFSLRHVRQIAILAGVVHSPIIGAATQQKILAIIKNFTVDVEYKNEFMQRKFQEIAPKDDDDGEFVENVWEVI